MIKSSLERKASIIISVLQMSEMKYRNEQRAPKVTGNSVTELRIALGPAGFSVGRVVVCDCHQDKPYHGY